MTIFDNLQLEQTSDADLQRQQLLDIIDFLSKTDFNPETSLSDFEVFFYQKNILFNDAVYLVGTFSTSALNFVIDKKMKELQPLLVSLYDDYKLIVQAPGKKLQLEDIKRFDEQIKVIKTYLDSLIVFDNNSNSSLTLAYEVYTNSSESCKLIHNYTSFIILSYIRIGDALISFYEHMYPFSKHYITESSEIYNHNYAQAFEDYFYNEVPITTAVSTSTILPTAMLQFATIDSRFCPAKQPGNNNTVFGETLRFNSYLELLQYDYLKALQLEHTIRICLNCGRAFLQTTKHHTVYCDRTASHYEDKTCRDVGALNKQKEKVQNSPIHQLYKRCYKKLNQRYNRGAITIDEFNAKISNILKCKEKALDGKINIEKFNDLLKKM